MPEFIPNHTLSAKSEAEIGVVHKNLENSQDSFSLVRIARIGSAERSPKEKE